MKKFSKKIFSEKKSHHTFEIPQIPYRFETVASFDPLTEMYKLEVYVPSEFLEPMLNSPSVNFTFRSHDIRERKDALIRHLLIDDAAPKKTIHPR